MSLRVQLHDRYPPRSSVTRSKNRNTRIVRLTTDREAEDGQNWETYSEPNRIPLGHQHTHKFSQSANGV